MSELFRKFAHVVSEWAGSVHVFALALFVILVWALTGPLFGFSDTWQLIINTGTTIVTFLMVFLIQNTQNRDNRAIQTKLDELIVHMTGADNRLVKAEEFSDEQLNRLKGRCDKLASQRQQRRSPRQSNSQTARSSRAKSR
jgi:low affinity Fe/Cu permease